MRRHFHNARLLDPATGLDTRGSVLVDNDTIIDCGEDLGTVAADEAIDCQGLCLSPGLIDLRVKTGEPGAEQKETLQSASAAAVAGGVTSMVVMPETTPVIDDAALVEFIARSNEQPDVLNKIYPAGALTVGLGGERMSEIGLMQDAGAVLFSNGDAPVKDSGVLKRTMQYAAGLGVLVSNRPEDRDLTGGAMNAGEFAARLGLKGIPKQAEWIGLKRDLILAEMTNCRYLADQISTGHSVELLAGARRNGQAVAASSAAHHLFFNELDIGDGTQDEDKAYLTYCKVTPPLRSEDDRQALIAAVRSGEIAAVVSAHDPQPPEDKRLPFEEASFGAIGLETLLSALLSLHHQNGFDLLECLRPITCGPADIVGLRQGRLAKGAPADLTLFNPDTPWKCQREDFRSKSSNSPFDGRLLNGRVMMTVVAGETVFERSQA